MPRQTQKKLFLRVDEVRRIKGVQRFTGADGVPRGLYEELLHPARDARVYVREPVFVPAHDADRLQRRREPAHFDGRRSHPERIHHGRRDLDGARWELAAVALLVDGDQIHTHRRLAGPVAAIIGVYRRDPVKRLPLAVAGSGTAGSRRRKKQGGDRSKTSRGGQGQDCVQFVVHGCTPVPWPARKYAMRADMRSPSTSMASASIRASSSAM